jgi:hypothetical protein
LFHVSSPFPNSYLPLPKHHPSQTNTTTLCDNNHQPTPPSRHGTQTQSNLTSATTIRQQEA